LVLTTGKARRECPDVWKRNERREQHGDKQGRNRGRGVGSWKKCRRGLSAVVLHNCGLPAFVSAMAWEERNGNRYYYQSERDEDGTVRKRYIGAGEIAELIAHNDQTRRRAYQERRERERAELERLKTADAVVEEFCKAVDTITTAALVAAGYRNHKGEWRLKRSGAN
jgi:hypothetical protein